MSSISCLIVEDEPLAAKILIEYISEVPFLELKEWFKDAISASDYLHKNNVDLIFLDIHLPRLKGIAFIKTIATPPKIILTTAYHEYAIEGFNLNVTDYLLKPIEFDRFLVAVNKVRSSQPEAHAVIDKEKDKDHIFLNVQKKKMKILFSDILYIESQKEYIKIVTTRKEFMTKMTTSEIEKHLPSHLFKRIHRSFIVAVQKIDCYTSEELEVNGVVIPIGREYRDVISEF